MKRVSYVFIISLFFISISLLIFLPWIQEEWYRSTINIGDFVQLKPNERVQLQKDLALIENSFRVTLAQIIGGSLLLLSLYLTYQNVKNAQENTRIAIENTKIATETLRVTEEGKLTDRFSKAVELLGGEKLGIRLGGIYALQRVARDSQKDHWTVMEVLTAFVRENSRKPMEETAVPREESTDTQSDGTDEIGLREDIQAIMTVIGRREWTDKEPPQTLDLGGVSLAGYNLLEANLINIDLNGADLSGKTILREANLSGVDLSGANLSGADLSKANLSGANLSGADLSGANLNRANLSKANFNEANLSGAHLFGADMTEGDFLEANLSGAYLRGAELKGASLWRAILIGVDLSTAKNAKVEKPQPEKHQEHLESPAKLKQELKNYSARKSKETPKKK